MINEEPIEDEESSIQESSKNKNRKRYHNMNQSSKMNDELDSLND